MGGLTLPNTAEVGTQTDDILANKGPRNCLCNLVVKGAAK
jgi:hypothetical protein